MEAIYTHTVVKTLLSVVESWSNNLSQQSSHEQRGNRAHHKRLCIWMLSDGDRCQLLISSMCAIFLAYCVVGSVWFSLLGHWFSKWFTLLVALNYTVSVIFIWNRNSRFECWSVIKISNYRYVRSVSCQTSSTAHKNTDVYCLSFKSLRSVRFGYWCFWKKSLIFEQYYKIMK